MAELGDLSFLNNVNEKEVAIDISMLDYQYVEDCKDVPTLKGILKSLKSNEHGHYPEVLLCYYCCNCCVL